MDPPHLGQASQRPRSRGSGDDLAGKEGDALSPKGFWKQNHAKPTHGSYMHPTCSYGSISNERTQWAMSTSLSQLLRDCSQRGKLRFVYRGRI